MTLRAGVFPLAGVSGALTRPTGNTPALRWRIGGRKVDRPTNHTPALPNNKETYDGTID